MLFIAYYFPRIVRRFKLLNLAVNPEQFIYIPIIKAGLYQSIAIYGFILGLLGADLKFIFPFLIASFVGLIHSFPSDRKWGKI